tara:strand:+ start:682 stop:900 length:219 start_codon:yes stop_codon:yes gene_type:complete
MDSEFINNFIDILDEKPDFKLNLNYRFRDLEEWDSLTALSLIAMLDESYDVKLTGDQLKNLETLEDIFNLLK